MSLIPTRIHGILDYLVGALFLALPWLLRFSHHRTATGVFLMLGVGAILYSLLTRYELGLYPLLSMRVHLAIDFASGLFLMASPWLLGFAEWVYWPHVLFGMIEVVVAAVTSRETSVVPAPLART
jgi:hypothetical protein